MNAAARSPSSSRTRASVGGIVVRDLRDVADERAVAVADGRDAGERRPVRVRAVVREATRHDHRPLRLADERPVAADDLARPCRSPRRRRVPKKTAASATGASSATRSASSSAGSFAWSPKTWCAASVRSCVADGVGDLRAPVADVREPEPGGRVEVLVARRRPRRGSPRRGRARARARRPSPSRRTGARAASWWSARAWSRDDQPTRSVRRPQASAVLGIARRAADQVEQAILGGRTEEGKRKALRGPSIGIPRRYAIA